MKNRGYWKTHYVLETDPGEIESRLRLTSFALASQHFELVFFEVSKSAPSILISPGSGGHSYVFAELGYSMHLKGYNVFIMPKHGSHTISELIPRHIAALNHIASHFNHRIGIFSEGLGGYVTFYLALAKGPVRSIVCQNAPAIMTEKAYQEAIIQGRGGARRRKIMIPLAKRLVGLFPNLKLPISSYLDWQELIDPKAENRTVETRLVLEGYLNDPDFDTWYSLAAIMSLLSTPPPNPLPALQVPTMFVLALRGMVPSYTRALYTRLPDIKKKLVEVDGSVYWMLSHPKEEARIVCEWFNDTL